MQVYLLELLLLKNQWNWVPQGKKLKFSIFVYSLVKIFVATKLRKESFEQARNKQVLLTH